MRTNEPIPAKPRSTWPFALVLVLAIGLIRSPTFNDHIIFIDEPIYYAFGSRLELPGAHVYTHTADQKPPLGPITYELASRISPEHAIAVVHVLTALAMAATGLLLLGLSRSFLGSPWPGFGAGLLYVLLSSGKHGWEEAWLAFSGMEHFQAPFLVGFLLLFLVSLRGQRVLLAVAAGASLGVAALYKQNVPVLLAPAWAVAFFAVRRDRVRPGPAAMVCIAAASTALMIVASVPLYYAAIGQFEAWRFYNVDMLVQYRKLGTSLLEEAALLGQAIPLKLPFALGLLYGAFVAPRDRRTPWQGETLLLLATSCVALFCSFTPGLHKEHYLIQLLPAACLLIAMAGAAGWRWLADARGIRRIAAGIAYLTLFAAPLAWGVYQQSIDWNTLRAYVRDDAYLALHRYAQTLPALVGYIRAHSAPDDLVYVHSEAPEFYFLAQRRPAVSDATGSWIAMAATPEIADRLLRELQASPPRLIVQLDYRRYGRNNEWLEKWPEIRAWITAHYRVIGPMPHVEIFELADPAP